MFPIPLDSAGLIGLAQPRPDQALIDEAAEQALTRISKAKLGMDEAGNVHMFVASRQLAVGELASAVPRDLFFPQRTQWQESRAIALPGGGQGVLSVNFASRLNESGSLADQAEREIVTKVGASQRTSAESWELVPA